MIVSPKFRAIAFACCVIAFILLIPIGIYRTNFLSRHNIIYDIIYTLSQLTYIIALVYVIELLKYAGENKSTVLAFYILTGMIIITSVMGFTTFPPKIMMVLVNVTDILFLLSVIYTIIVSFMIKTQSLSIAFKVFGIAQVVMLVLTFGVTLLLAYINPVFYFKVSRYMHFGGLISIAALTNIVYSSGKLVYNHAI